MGTIAAVALFRVVGSLAVLRWPVRGAVLALVVDLLDLLVLGLLHPGGWTGLVDYQPLDKWLDQVYLGCFLLVAYRRFDPIAWRISLWLFTYRLVGSLAYEAGLLPREALIVFPNLFETWFLAVAIGLAIRPAWRWSPRSAAIALVPLLALKLAQEWALHVARLLDSLYFLDVVQSIWRQIAGPFGAG